MSEGNIWLRSEEPMDIDRERDWFEKRTVIEPKETKRLSLCGVSEERR